MRNIQRKKVLKQALIYVCGFIKKKLHTKVSGLVRVGEEKTNCDWIDLKSRESLFYPSKDLLEEVEKYEKIFQKIHGESLDRGHDPIEKTISTISKTQYFCNPMSHYIFHTMNSARSIILSLRCRKFSSFAYKDIGFS